MKAITLNVFSALALSFGLAACVPATKPAPAPAPRPVARPAPTPTPAPPPVIQAPASSSWIDAPLTAGGWIYEDQSGGGMALFSGARGEPLLMLECDRDTGTGMQLLVLGSGRARVAVIRTETATRSLSLSPVAGNARAQIAANDPLLDAMALSKGRFAVEVDGIAPLYLPSWAEVSRVIEDCR